MCVCVCSLLRENLCTGVCNFLYPHTPGSWGRNGRDVLLLHFSHFINTWPWHTSERRQNTGQDEAERGLRWWEEWNQSSTPACTVLNAERNHLKCLLFGILLEIENAEVEGREGETRARGIRIYHKNKRWHSHCLSGCVAFVQFLSSGFFFFPRLEQITHLTSAAQNEILYLLWPHCRNKKDFECWCCRTSAQESKLTKACHHRVQKRSNTTGWLRTKWLKHNTSATDHAGSHTTAEKWDIFVIFLQ